MEVQRIESPDLTEMWAKLTRRGQPSIPAVATNTNQSAPAKTQRLTTFLNRWVMIPDKSFPWIRPAAAAGERLIREKNIAAIFSTSDPLTDHLVALRLAQRTGVPWVAEFRDLWLGSPYLARTHPTAIHRAIHTRMERRVVAGAKTIICLSRGIQHYFTTAYPGRKTRSIYNCFDPEEYPPAPAPEAGKFSVLYTGALYSSRSPVPFLDGWARFLAQCQLTPDTAEFTIFGGSSDLDLAGLARQYGVEQSVKLTGRVTHVETLRQMQAATVLLAIQSPEDDVHFPVSYLNTPVPVVPSWQFLVRVRRPKLSPITNWGGWWNRTPPRSPRNSRKCMPSGRKKATRDWLRKAPRNSASVNRPGN